MLALMLDPRLKNIWLVTTYLHCENVVVILVEYDEKLMLPLLIKTTKLLMPISVEEDEDMQSQDNAENIFHITSTNGNNHMGFIAKRVCWILSTSS
jgi:hypothetical protein